jgi:hypothetical protein
MTAFRAELDSLGSGATGGIVRSRDGARLTVCSTGLMKSSGTIA